MKKRVLSIILALIFCITLEPAAGASTTTEASKSVLLSNFSFAITANGDLYWWGYWNPSLGGEFQTKPVKVLSNVASVTTYDGVVAAITTNGDLYCWGNNIYGQVGNGKLSIEQTAADYVFQDTPVKVLSNVTSVTIATETGYGVGFSGRSEAVTMAAVTKSGDLYSWGFNASGKVGNGQSGKFLCQATPVKVLSNVASIKLNEGTVAALVTNGDLYSWGYNGEGQVGNGKIGKDAIQTTPVKVLSDVAALMSNDGPTAAITKNGDLYCWGYNSMGQVGNGTKTHQTTPVKVLSDVASVTTGMTTTGLTNSGDLYCWGYTENGQVGNGNRGVDGRQMTPVKVLSNVVSVTSSIVNTAAITKSGDLYCWGANDFSQVGNGTIAEQDAPVKVLSNVASLTTDKGYSSAAITTSGDLYCWGSNNHGQIGNGKVGKGMIQAKPIKVLSGVRLPNALPAAPVLTATPTASKVLVDGKNVDFDAYNIEGNNYFKLRDLAYILNGSAKQISVAWDGANNAIALMSGEIYTAVGGEMATKGKVAVTPKSNTSKITLNSKPVPLTAYNIGGNNYFKLRDIGAAVDFDVSWDNVANTIVIDTTSSYTLD